MPNNRPIIHSSIMVIIQMKNPLEVLFISFQGQLLNNQKYYKHQIYERNGKNGKANYCFFDGWATFWKAMVTGWF